MRNIIVSLLTLETNLRQKSPLVPETKTTRPNHRVIKLLS